MSDHRARRRGGLGHRVPGAAARAAVVAVAFALGAAAAVAGCERSSAPWEPTGGSGGDGGTFVTSGVTSTALGGAGAGGAGGEGAGGGLPDPTEYATCGGVKIYECGDLIDNDDDGLVDYQDPDCLGACDNSEDSLWPDLLGILGPMCEQDCFWDAGNGHEDECYWSHYCDPHANDQSIVFTGTVSPQENCAFSGTDAEQQAMLPPDDPSGVSCGDMFASQAQTCLDTCQSLTPNGCDCFGCCELGGAFVWLGSLDETGSYGLCDLGDVGEPHFFEECHPCTPVPACENACESCEICVGKGELPPACGGEQDCPAGAQRCGLSGQPLCPSGSYCITGCCQALLP